MPKYSYKCTACDYNFFIRHAIKEVYEKCPECGLDNSLLKEINNVAIKKISQANAQHVGELTKQYIEENKDLLKTYKKDLQGKEHNDVKNISD